MAKKVIRDEQLNLDIVVDGNKGQMQLGKLEEESRKLKQQVKDIGVEMSKTKDKDSAAYKTMLANRKELNKLLRQNMDQQTALRRELGLHGLTYKQLNQEAKRLSAMLNNATHGTAQWKKLDAELRRVRARMAEVRGGAQQTGASLSKMATGFNKYFMMISTFAVSIGGLIMGIRKASLAFAEFDDKIADVMKTTGLTKDEVKQLNKELENIDTRSSQEDLMNLARIAGKLGINASQDVLEFVRAADKINVALSEDLGGNAEDAIRELGKLTDIFKLKDEYGMEQSLLKVGSAINSLGAASTANEPYLVEFTKRLAGIAPSVDISIQNVLGLAASLDQLGQTSEVSSTVMSQLIPKMFKDTATFANIARMSLADFSKLLKEDTNEAMLRVLEGLKGNAGGFEALVAALGDIGLEGKRTVSVLGVLANNTDLVRQQQAFANDEFEKGTSIIDEFNVKNETARAGLDRAVKSIKQTTRELGEKLQPVISRLVSSGTMLVRSLSSAVDFFIKYGNVIKVAALALGTFIVTTKAYSVAILAAGKAKAVWSTVTALFTGKINLASKAMQFFNTVSKANVIGLVVSAVTAAAAAFALFRKQANDATQIQKEFNSIQKDAALQERNQVAELDKLFAALRKTTHESKERKKIIDTLQSQHNVTIQNYKDQKQWEQELTRAYKEGTTALRNRIAVQVYDQKLAALRAKEMEYEEGLMTYYKQRQEYEEKIAKAKRGGANAQGVSTLQGIYERASAKMAEYNKLLQDNRRLQEDLSQKSVKLSSTLKDLFTTDEDGGLFTPGMSEEDRKKLEKEREKLEKEAEKLAEKIRQEYEKLSADIELIELTDYQRSIKLLERKLTEQKQILDNAMGQQLISQEQYNSDLLKLETEYAVNVWELTQKELEQWQAYNDEQYAKALELEEKKYQLRERYGLVKNDEMKNRELAELDAFYGDSLTKDEAYHQARVAIEKKYNDYLIEERNRATEATISTFANMFGTIAGFFEEGSQEYKLFASFQVTLDTIQAAMSAYKSMIGIPGVGPILAPIAAATAAAFGIAQMAKINSTPVPQYFGGYYDVVGEQTGKHYQAKYKGKPQTGYVSSPSLYLAGDDPHRLKEMIISGPDLKNPMIADYARAIMDIKANKQPMYGPGAQQTTAPQQAGGGAGASQSNAEMVVLLKMISEKLDNPTRSFVVYSDLETKQKKLDRIRTDVSRS
jgi:TP901 family phage tail tape measure protein